MTLRSPVRIASALSALALAACSNCSGAKPSGGSPSSSSKSVQKDGPVVARIGEDVITAEEVKQKLGEQSPFLQARYKDLAHKKEFVQNLVRFEVLAQEAYRRELERQPEVQNTIKKILVQELIRQEFDEKKATYTEQELKDYYDKHVDEFVKPERVRASQIFIAAGADKKDRSKAKQKAAELLSQLKENDAKAAEKHPKHDSYQPNLFADLARKESQDPATQATGGDMRYLAKADMAKQYSSQLADAAFALEEGNQLSGVVEDDKGFRVVKLMNRQLAVNRSFDEQSVKDTIKGRLFREQRTKTFDEYVEKLKTEAKVSIDERVLETVEVPAGAAPPTGMPGVPPQPPVAGQR